MVFLEGVMPLISKAEKDNDKDSWRIRMRKEVCQEVTAYCEWADIRYRDYFLEEACKYIFANDAQWVEYKNRTKQLSSDS